MYLQVPRPILYVNHETGKPLTDEDITDDKGRTFKSLGIPYRNEPMSMRRWFLRYIADLFTGYNEMKAARRIEKALAKAEKERTEEGPLPVVEVKKDDVDMLRIKIETLSLPATIMMQMEAFLEAVDKVSEEKPKAEFHAVDAS